MNIFGETLRKAREAKGLSTSQVAAQTHILVQIIEAMEREDFSRIPAAIYGRGFVRHICECLAIDPQPLLAEFMEIYTGRKPKSDDPFQPKPPSPVPAPEPTLPPEAAVPPPVQPSFFDPPPAPAPQEQPPAPILPEPPPPASVPQEQPPVTRAQDIFSAAYAPAEPEAPRGPSAGEKFRESLSVVSHGVVGGVRRIPRNAWRLAVLAIGAIGVIVLIVWGCTVLYRVTERPAAASGTTASAAQPVASAQPAARPAKLRSTGGKVPPLYVD